MRACSILVLYSNQRRQLCFFFNMQLCLLHRCRMQLYLSVQLLYPGPLQVFLS